MRDDIEGGGGTGGGGEVYVSDRTPPSLTVSGPADWAEVTSTTLRVTGSAYDPAPSADNELGPTGMASVTAWLHGTSYAASTGNGWTSWAADVAVSAWVPAGGANYVLEVIAKDVKGNATKVTRNIAARDRTPPELVVSAPAQNAVITDTFLDVSGTVRDDIGGTRIFSGVARVELHFNGAVTTLHPAGEAWSARLPVPAAAPAGGKAYTLVVKAYDHAGNVSEQTRSLTARDATAPALRIDLPEAGAEFTLKDGRAVVRFAGFVSDTFSGGKVKSDVKEVVCRLGSTDFRATLTAQGDGYAWSADVVAATDGTHTVQVRWSDNAGNADARQVSVAVARPFVSGSRDVFGPQGYLADLLDLAAKRLAVGSPTGSGVDRKLLSDTFHQPFARLEAVPAEVATRPVRQARLGVETLRRHLPVAYWAFDERAGTVAADSLSSGIAGTLNGPQWQPGKAGGGSLSFDGNDEVVMGSAPALEVKDAFTLAAWIYPTESTAAWGGTILSRNGEYALSCFANGAVLYLLANEQNSWSWYETGYVAPKRRWTHLALTYDRGLVRLFVNGNPVPVHERQLSSASVGDAIAADDAFRVGSLAGAEPFVGQVDEVKVFARALHPAEVTALAAPPATLVAHWKLEEGSGTAAADATGKGNTGTVHGAAWTAGRLGAGALAFDGVDDRVAVASGQHLRDVTNDFTLTFWAKPTATHELDAEAASGSSGVSGQRWAIYPQQGSGYGAGHAGVGVSVGTNGISVYEHADGYLPAVLVHRATLEGWTHVAVVYRDRQPRLYVNGVLVRTGVVGAATQVHAAPEAIGGSAYGWFKGELDDVRVYSRVLSADTLAALARGGYGEPQFPGLARAEADYRQAAYELLLNRVGTSYEEVRLARVAEPGVRAALAARLGITLSPQRPDELDELLLDPARLSEGELERVFGLASTTRDPLAAAPEPRLLAWRRAHLRARWKREDQEGRPGEALVPVIEPDLVGADDLRDAVPGNTAYDLWQARRARVDQELAAARAQREGAAGALAGWNALVAGTWGASGPADLVEMAERRARGEPIDGDLREKGIAAQAFAYLMRIRALAAAGSPVLDSEWADACSIVVQVRKQGWYADWRAVERQKDVVLEPARFRVPGEEGAPAAPALPAWRATSRDRRAWQERLRARADQAAAAAQGVQAAVDAAEEAALPLLRDALVRAAGEGEDLADRLTKRLLVDLNASGFQKTTRADQAIETLQATFFSQRAGRFQERDPQLGANPAAAWVLSVAEDKFDREWQWMGTYASWRAAMFVFVFPENVLLPSLRETHAVPVASADPTPEFQRFVAELRARQPLTPDGARAVAADYLARLKARLGAALPSQIASGYEITEKRTEPELRALGQRVQAAFGAATRLDQVPSAVKEVFYFVPVQIALQLQKAGQYLAALDWFQTVYAYNLRPEERRIYHGFRLEQSIQTRYQRNPDEWLHIYNNPHDVAGLRANAYTRFTLLSLARCFVDYADSEFARDTEESLPRARGLYMTALDLLDLPEMQEVGNTGDSGTLPPNPVLESLHAHASTNLLKLRSGRNIAGMQRQLAGAGRAVSSMPTVGAGGQFLAEPAAALHPTPYYFSVLIDRAKQLAAQAQQVEGAYLAALERKDQENYSRLEAGNHLELAGATVQLQALRVREAERGITLARHQQARAGIQAEHYGELLEEGISALEKSSLAALGVAAGMQAAAAVTSMVAATLPSSIAVSASIGFPPSMGVSVGYSPQGALNSVASGLSSGAAAVSTGASIMSTLAGYERRKQEWELQQALSLQDARIAAEQVAQAQDHREVVRQESAVATLQERHARAVADFLAQKFTSAELYEWMSGVLGGVYSYFLQQATAMARLAQSQLAFERQETPPAFIQADYWRAPSDGGAAAATPDRRGITGSARLLQDIYQLDQYAFDTNKRKLQLAQTFSLAQLAPFEFQRFRETGKLSFNTPMELFDRAFPGHYLRLIRRVRTSVVALVPPAQGIRATLTAGGISRVVTGGQVFQPAVVRRDPESVSLTSPRDATGLFEMDIQSDMLLPFEGMGVDTSWELLMPKASNPFSFDTISDVLLTVEYTALSSLDYRQQVIRSLDTRMTSERRVSLRHEFPDQWYALANAAAEGAVTVPFTLRREHFPPNVEEVRIDHLLLYFAPANGSPVEARVAGLHYPARPAEPEAEVATLEGVISTRRGNGGAWTPAIGTSPVGEWRITIADTETRERFRRGEIEDVSLVVAFSGQTPAWV